jgi:hypothetical protein
MVTEGQTSSERRRAALADERDDRRARAGRLEFIKEAVTLQQDLARISRRIKEAQLHLSEHGVDLTSVELFKLGEARTQVLNAADFLHVLALQYVGELRRDPI